jgi:type I restriction enzyme S subunit
MQYSAYPDYSDCKLSWLDEIPIGWDVIPIKFGLEIPITDGPHETPELYNEGVPFLSAEAVKKDKLDFNRKRGFISQEEHQRFSKKYKPKRGDVYMVKSGATTGNVARVETDEEFNIWSPLAAMRPEKDMLDTDFLFYFMKSKPFFHSVELGWNFGTQQNIGMGVIADLQMALPQVETQQKIAAFLDYKTQQIDQLIENKKALIEKLEEKRIAVITQAVTKGLDKNVKLKPSGVDWLGDVPDGWKVRKLRFMGVCQNGINIGAEFFGRGDPFVSYGDVYNNKELPSSVKGLVQSSDSDKKAYSVETGDILFTRTSETIEEIGFSSVCMKTIEDAVFAGFLIRVRPGANEISMKFSKYYFQNILLRAFFVKEMNLVTRASLSQDLLKKLPVLLPTIDEQIIIAKYLDEATSKTEKMVKKVQSAIDKLIEYRTAIVTSAVTGKIDVREVEVSKEVA